MCKVSIITPVYNVEKYLARCMDSLINQSFKDIEIIVIDDGSTDSSYNIASNLALLDNRIKLFRQENRGLSAARNSGLKLATGKYLMFLDSDDYFDLKVVEKCYKKISKDNSDVVIFSFEKVDEKGQTIEINYPKRQREIKLKKDKKLLTEVENCVWDKMYKRSLFSNIDFPEGFFYEDFGTTYRILAKADKISFLDKNYIGLYYLYNRKGSITNTIDSRVYSIFSMSNLIIEYFKENNYFELYRNELDEIICREIIECVKQVILCKDCNVDFKFKSSFVDEAYDFMAKNCMSINCPKGEAFVYKNKYLLKLYMLLKGRNA